MIKNSKKIIFVTEHPAPYWDEAFLLLDKYCDLTVIYIQEFVKSKPWKNYKYFPGIFYCEKLKLIKTIFQANHIIIGGYYRKELRNIILFSILFQKKISLFTDVQKNYQRNPFKSILKKVLFMNFSFFFVSGRKGIKYLNETYNISKKKLMYLPYAYSKPVQNNPIKQISFDKLNILISSRFEKRKGHEVLVSALKKSQKKVLNNCHFIFLGDGKLKNDINLKLNKINFLSFEMLGWIGINSYYEYLSKCNVLIHPSYFEPFGIPVIDSLNRGLIVIASDGVMSAYDFIDDSHNGFIYQNNSCDELASKMAFLVDNKSSLKSISEKAKSTIPDYEFYLKKIIDFL
tara:strand:- start:12743 stop:13777 length:1035 start_codon:yes stop_codon:yes gene_type:complete